MSDPKADENAGGASPKRVLFLAPQPFYEDRGTPIAVRHVLEALSSRGIATDLITFPVGQAIDLPGLRIFRVGQGLPIQSVPIGLSGRKLLLDGLLIAAALHRLSQERYDCIHAVEEAAFPAALIGRAHQTPVLYDMASSLPGELAHHGWLGSGPAQRVLRGLERWLFRRVDHIVCSAGLASHVAATPGAAPVEEWIFPSDVPDVSDEDVLKLREELDLPCHAPVVLYAGSFAVYQGIDLLIEAASRVHQDRPDVVFVLVGAAGEGAPHGDRPTPWLRVVPRQPREIISRYLAMADVLVSPRLGGDNLPSKIFDFLSAGKPIVATDCAAHRSVLDASRARLVPPNPQSLASALISLIDRPDLRDEIGAAGRAFARMHLSRETFAEFVIQNYQSCMRRALGDGSSRDRSLRGG